jgi:riboflavin biosynthesis pyrimidine reductase
VEALSRQGVKIEIVEATINGRVELVSCLDRLTEQGIRSLFVEGGSSVITEFIREDLVGKMVIVTSPLIIGAGTPAVGDIGVVSLDDAVKPEKVRGRKYGNEYVWELILHEP